MTKSINAQVALYGKNAPKTGRTPAIALINPKCGHNVGAAVRAASCFGAKQVWFTGDRVSLDSSKRLPREERMKGYKDVELRQFDNFFEQFENVTPVAIELRPNAESLATFQHPDNALYVFGPEDGSLGAKYLSFCHRFVVIPTRHCLNLSAAVNIILYDRLIKENPNITIYDTLAENRVAFTDNDNFYKEIGLCENNQ